MLQTGTLCEYACGEKQMSTYVNARAFELKLKPSLNIYTKTLFTLIFGCSHSHS